MQAPRSEPPISDRLDHVEGTGSPMPLAILAQADFDVGTMV